MKIKRIKAKNIFNGKLNKITFSCIISGCEIWNIGSGGLRASEEIKILKKILCGLKNE